MATDSTEEHLFGVLDARRAFLQICLFERECRVLDPQCVEDAPGFLRCGYRVRYLHSASERIVINGVSVMRPVFGILWERAQPRDVTGVGIEPENVSIVAFIDNWVQHHVVGDENVVGVVLLEKSHRPLRDIALKKQRVLVHRDDVGRSSIIKGDQMIDAAEPLFVHAFENWDVLVVTMIVDDDESDFVCHGIFSLNESSEPTSEHRKKQAGDRWSTR